MRVAVVTLVSDEHKQAKPHEEDSVNGFCPSAAAGLALWPAHVVLRLESFFSYFLLFSTTIWFFLYFRFLRAKKDFFVQRNE